MDEKLYFVVGIDERGRYREVIWEGYGVGDAETIARRYGGCPNYFYRVIPADWWKDRTPKHDVA